MDFAKWIVFWNDSTFDPNNAAIFAPVTLVDEIWANGGQVGDALVYKSFNQFSMPFGLGGTALQLQITALIVYLVTAALCLYTMFLLALSKVALAVLLAMGPIFLVMLLFESTSRYFTAWIAQLTNYALVTILTTMVSLLILTMVRADVAQIMRRISLLAIVDVFDMLLMCGLGMLFMMQVPQIAASLASGGSPLGTHGVGARAVGGVGRFSRGFASARKEISAEARAHWPTAQRAGYAAGRGIARLLARDNTIKVKR